MDCSAAQELSAEFLRGLTDETEAAGTFGGGSLDGFDRSSVKDGSDMADEVDADDDQRRVRHVRVKSCERSIELGYLYLDPWTLDLL